MVVALVQEVGHKAKLVLVFQVTHHESTIRPDLVDDNQAGGLNVAQEQRQVDDTQSKHLAIRRKTNLLRFIWGIAVAW